MSETSKFCPKIRIILSENVREHEKHACSAHLINHAVVCFHKENHLKNQATCIIIRLEALMKNHENNSYCYIDHLQRLKMNKDTTFHTSQKSICPKLNPNYSFDTPKLLVRISQTFVRNLSEKTILGQNRTFFGQNDLNFVRKRKN